MIQALASRIGKSLTILQSRSFTGKTELPKKFKTPTIMMRTCTPVYPPPGLNLKVPDWTPEYFMKQIGGDCGEYGDKFKNMLEIFTFHSV